MITNQQIGSALVVTLARPPVNAINGDWIDRFDSILDGLDERGDIAVLHIRSGLRVFCAGADLDLMRRCFARPEGRDDMIAVVARLQALFLRLERLPQVTIVEIGGTAAGGGFELALSCDLRVVSHDAQVGLPEVQLGLLPGAGGTQRLARLCGRGIAQRVILSGQLVDGETACRLGMAQWAVPPQELAGWTAQLVAAVAALPLPALAASKRCLAVAGDRDAGGFRRELEETRQLLDRAETQSRITAFLDRRRGRAGEPPEGRERVAP